MRVSYVLVVAAQAVAVIAADVPTIKWTLHRSCYRNADDTEDDNVVADAIVKSVETVKAWAKKGAQKLEDSVSLNPLVGKATKEAMIPLIGEDGYKERAKEVRDRLKKLEGLDGPIGKEGDAGGRYGQSNAWTGLATGNEHWLNFVITCRPELIYVEDPISGIGEVPFDVVRGQPLSRGAILEEMLNQAGVVWRSDDVPRVQALTLRDDKNPPEGGRVHIPETINFHPSWIQYQRNRNFAGWSQEILDEVTAADALEVFKAKGAPHGADIRPIDGLLDPSFDRNMFHEMFHLTAFGRMYDDNRGAYRWANNIKYKSLVNPDIFAIIAVIIELLNKDGQQYKVSPEGAVSLR